tara:strand:- start:1328 stop:1702 length:375 start_codon:yes stop_codon:yes gene_type:complete
VKPKQEDKEMELVPEWLKEAQSDPLQTSLFEGESARDEAVANLDLAYDGWIDSVIKIILSIPIYQTFTTDYLWEQVETTPNEPRAMGAVMTRAKKEGLVSSTGKYIKSRRPECHARPVMIWRRT